MTMKSAPLFLIGLVAFAVLPRGQGQAPAVRAELVSTYTAPEAPTGAVRGGFPFADFSPDGKLLIIGQGGAGLVYDVATKKQIQTLNELRTMGQNARFSPDGKRLAGTILEGTLFVWETARWERLELRGKPGDNFSRQTSPVAWLPDSNRIAALTKGGVNVWNVDKREVEKHLPHPDVQSVAASPASPEGVLAIADKEKVVLWDLARQMKLAELEHAAAVLQFSQDGGVLVSLARQTTDNQTVSTIKIWDPKTAKLLSQLKHDGSVEIGLSPNGKRLLACMKEKENTVLKVLDTATAQVLFSKDLGKTGPYYNLVPAWSRDGTQAATVALFQPLQLWRYEEKKP